jgi:hypothetical protein
MHTDFDVVPESDDIVKSALEREVPVVSGRQMLEWLDGRNKSTFDSLAFVDKVLSFSISVGAGAHNLHAMLPVQSGIGTLVSITRDGVPIDYPSETIKGVEYALFPAMVGTYRAIYLELSLPDSIPPTVSVTTPADGAIVSGTVTLGADAADNIWVAGVQFMLDGVPLGAEDTVSPYSLTWDTSTATNGLHELTALARDHAGNSTTVSSVKVIVNNPIDTTPPAVLVVTPADGALDVAVNASVSITFSEVLDAATVGASTIELRGGTGDVVAALTVVSYDSAAQTATLSPVSHLANSTTYTVLIRGGDTDPRVKDLAGNALARDYSWSFSTAGVDNNAGTAIWLPLIANLEDAR